jgi:hypothetical protein
MEYKLALELNLKNKCIKHIYVIWDDSTGNYQDYFPQHDKVTVINYNNRPSFQYMFNLCNEILNQELCCLCNGDIVLTGDISKLKSLNMRDKLLSLTRWEFVSEKDIEIFNYNGEPNIYSQDTWIFKTPVTVPGELELIQIGTVNCDCKLTKIYKHYQFDMYNPCMDIKTLHLHLQNTRKQDYSVANTNYVECCTLQNIY